LSILSLTLQALKWWAERKAVLIISQQYDSRVDCVIDGQPTIYRLFVSFLNNSAPTSTDHRWIQDPSSLE